MKRRPVILALAIAGTLSFGTAAWAYWGADGDGDSVALTGSLNPPTGVTATAPLDSDTVALTWTGATLATGEPATGYYVTRIRTSDGATFTACGTAPAAPTASVGCSDSPVSDGDYRYVVTGLFASWTAASQPSNDVTVINDSSLPSISVTSLSPAPNGNGYNNSSPVVVNLSASAGLGIASITYTLDSEPAVTVTTDTASVTVTGDGSHTVAFSATDTVGNVSGTGSVFVRIDMAAPAVPSAPTLTAASDTGSSSSDRITKVTTPTFTGTAEDGSTVTLFDGVTAVGTAVATGGTWSITSGALTNGMKSMSVTSTDGAGNVGAASAGTAVTIDTVAPAAASTPTLTAASDSGSSSSDGITNVTTPTFTGTAEDGSTVTLYNSATAVGTAAATGGGYSVTSSALTAGTKTMTARATDVAGNVGAASAGRSVTIDVTAPSAPGTPTLNAANDTGRSATDGITGLTALTVTGSATTGTVVTLYDGATTRGSVTTATSSYSIASGILTEGAHSLTARAADVAGNVSAASATKVVTVDTVAPAAPSAPTLSGATNDTGASATDRITKLATPALSGTNESLAIVRLYDGAVQVGTRTTTAATYSATSSTLATGDHTMTTTATDVAGNVGPASASTTITIDTTAPAAPSAPVLTAASDTGISSSDKLTKLRTPTLTGTAEDGITVSLFNGASATGVAVTATGGLYSATTASLSTGVRVITARATDVAGNVAASPATNITLDYTAPTVTLNQASGQADPTTGTSIGFTAVFNEVVYGLTGSGITFGGTALPTTATITGSGTTYGVAISGMAKSGTVMPRITAGRETDAAGNLNAVSTTTDGTVTYSDVTAPAAASAPVLTVAGDTGISSTDGITKTAAASYTGTAEAGATVALFDGATATGASVIATGGIYTATSGTLAPGVHTITARVTDPSGNAGPASVATTVTIDTTAPTVTLNQESGQADPTTATPIAFTAVFTEAVYGLSGTAVTFGGTAGSNAAAVGGAGTTFTVAISGMTRTGTVIPRIAAGAAQDTAGNLNTISTATDGTVTFTDSTAPTVAIDSFAPGASQSATAAGTAGFGPGDSTTVTVVFCTVNSFPCLAGNTTATLTTVVTASTGVWSVASGTLGTTATLYARATQTDLTGNTGQSPVAGPIAIA